MSPEPPDRQTTDIGLEALKWAAAAGAWGQMCRDAIQVDEFDLYDQRGGSAFHGDMRFYRGDAGNWEEYEARFTEGRLVRLMRVERSW